VRTNTGTFSLEIASVACRLASPAARLYIASVSTISVTDLRKKPASQWLKSAGGDDLIITSKGQPVAVLLRIAAASVESTRSLLRSVRALQAQAALQQAAAANGTAGLTLSDIDAEIAAARRARRRK
jgi:antitoxin (DNA-binding transcriptional repressor) of toxin-antitoxin stability system